MIDQLGRSTMSKDLSNHTRHAFDTPAVKRGSLDLLGPHRYDVETLAALFIMPSGMSSLHDNKRTGQPTATRARTVANHVSHLRMLLGKFSSSQPMTGGANPALAEGKTNGQKRLATTVFEPQSEDWWSQTGSNRRPQACKASALPTELWPRSISAKRSSEELVGLSGLEPLTSRLSGVCSNHLSYRPSEDRRSPSVLTDRSPKGCRSAELTEHSGKKEKRSRRLGRWTYRIP